MESASKSDKDSVPPRSSNVVEAQTPPILTNATGTSKELSGSNQRLTKQKSQSNLSRVSFRIDQTFKQIVTRIHVANKLSMAKRAEDQYSISGPTLIDEPNSCSGSKIIRDLAPSINMVKKSQPSSSLSSSFYKDEDGKVKEGIISGGSLLFDVDYPLATDAQKRISRPYIYVTPDVQMKTITDLMFDEWHLSMPRIALFLLTDPDHFRTWHNPRQIASFKNGIMKAAKTTSMWLVTNGLDVGVGKLIGDALIEEQNEIYSFRSNLEKTSRKQFPVIGITKDFHLSYAQEFFGATIQLGKPGPIPEQRRYELNPMHTNFLLIQSQNSSDDSYHGFMINLIDHLTKRTLLSQEPDDRYQCKTGQNSPVFTNYIPCDDPSSFPKENVLRNRKRSAAKFVRNDFQQNFDTIIRPFSDQKTSGDEDVIDSRADEEETSFISPEGMVVEDEVLPPPLPILETDAQTTRVKDLNETIIPVVCLVIQGDYNCAKLVLDNIRRRNPVLVLRGSGGFADLLSFAYIEMQHRCRDLYHAWDAEFVEQTLKPLLSQKIVKHFPEFRNNALARNTFRDRIIESVRESGSPRGRVYLSILNMHNSSCDLANLPEFILLSLFKSQNRRRNTIDSSLIRKDLYLTLDWNCPVVALDEVLSKNPTYNIQLEKSIFEIAILKSNREDFVDLFLSHGFRIHKYLTPLRLIRLIRHSLLESDFFRTVCMEAILGVAVWSLNFDELLERLSINCSQSGVDDFKESFLVNEFNQLIYTTTSLHDFVNVNDMYLNIMGMYPVDAGSAERKALATLAMWSAFNCRFKLMEILWKHSDQPIHLGLIISMILDRMAWFVPEQNLKDDLQRKSKTFAQFAINVLDVCYRNDEQRGYDLLGQKNSDWDQQTAVDIAANGQHRAFIAHPCCQKWLTNTFNGRIRVRELSWGFLTIPPVVKIILSAFLIIPMYIWIRFLDVNHQWTVDKDKLLAELNQEESLDSDDDDQLLEKAADELKLIPLNHNHNQTNSNEENQYHGNRINSFKSKKKSNPLEFLVDNQMTITSIDNDQVREALQRLTRKMKKRQESSSSSYDRKRKEFFIDRQPPLWTMIYLMWNSPITKFWTYQVFYIIYLALLSLAVIWPGCGNWYLDTVVCTWTFLNVIEYIERVFVLYRRYTSVPMFFRIIETILLIIFLLIYTWGRVLVVYSYHINGHWLTRYNIDPYLMKVILSAGLLYHYYRMFYIHLPISPTLGPLLFRFKLMVSVDFIHFMRMALILLLSSGVIIQALLYPNAQFSATMFHRAFHRTIVSLFATPVEELTRNCTSSKNVQQPVLNESTAVNSTLIFLSSLNLDSMKSVSISAADLCPVEAIPIESSCPVAGFWSYLFTFQFLICLKLILMTLLYALFASTASKLQTETDYIWKYQRYILVIDFANRPALCSPLSIFEYLYSFLIFWFRRLYCICCFWNRKKSTKVADQPDSASKGVFMFQEEEEQEDNKNDSNTRLSKEDYNYWRYLAKAIYDEEQRKEEEKQILAKQGETIQLICEELEHEKNILRTLKTKLNEFERMMYQTQIYLENMKNVHVAGGNGIVAAGKSSETAKRIHLQSTTTADLNFQIQTGIHYLSRLSPYAGTRIQRFPVADKFVSWDVIWINYDPVIFSRTRENFPTSLKPWVDEDLLAIKEQMKAINQPTKSIHLPVFNWNAISVNPAGLTIDRRSWIKQNIEWDILDCNLSPKVTTTTDENNYSIYKLDEDGIPLNLLGRTGLRGKGNLPRWGPNHYVMLIVSRSRILTNGAILSEFALERRYSSLFAPMRFIGDEKLFSDLWPLFACRTNEQDNEKDFVGFFRSIYQDVHVAPTQVLYLDSPENTDNAWKEVKLYHFHYGQKVDPQITDKMIHSNNNDGQEGSSRNKRSPSAQLTWISYNEDMLVQLPMEQVSYINDAFRRIQNWDV